MSGAEREDGLSGYAQRNRWPAPAKINLFLHVLGKRPDGYHDLQTVFQFLDYGDELQFALNRRGEITRGYDHGFSESDDLCLRAAHLLKAEQPDPRLGVTIDLHKRLPMGGGLGGGSSDAATVLMALNHLWELHLPRSRLAELGLQLGADVPVFIGGQAAWAEGIGERLTPLQPPQRWFLVCNPKINVSTAEVFANKHLTACPQMMKIRAFQNAGREHFGENQLEPIVRRQYPPVDELFRWLQSFGKPRMSGSGGAIFLPLESQQQGVQLLSALPVDVEGFVARGSNRHPLYMGD